MARSTEAIIGSPASIAASPLACPTCNSPSGGAYCANCGTEVATGREFGRAHHHEKTTKQAMRVMLAPVFEYFEHARALIDPRRMAEHIKERHFTGIDVTGLWVAAAVLAALAGAIFPNGVERIEIPILVEVLEATAAMALTILVYGPFYFFVRDRPRTATFREFLLTTLAISGLLYPWNALGQGIFLKFGVTTQHFNNWATVITATFFVRAYAALFRRSIGSTIAWVALYVGVLIATAMVVGFGFRAVRTQLSPVGNASVAAAKTVAPTHR